MSDSTSSHPTSANPAALPASAAPSAPTATFNHCYQNFVGDRDPLSATWESQNGVAQSDDFSPTWLSRPIGKLGVIGLGGLAVTLMAGQLLPPATQPPAAAQAGTTPAQNDVIPEVKLPGTDSSVIPSSGSNPEFSKSGDPAKDLKFLADVQSAQEAGLAIRAPLPGQVIAQQLPSLNLESMSINPLLQPSFAAAMPASPDAASATGEPLPAEAAAPIRVEAGSTLALAIAPPETTAMMALNPRSLPAAPSVEKPEALGDRATAQPPAPLPQTQRQPTQLQEPTATTAPWSQAESTFNAEGIDVAPQIVVNHDAALKSMVGTVFDASLEKALQPLGNTIESAPGQPAPIKLSDPAVEAWLSRPVPANQARQIAALPLTARATIEASTGDRLDNLQVLHVSAQDYQKLWTVLASTTERSAPAPEYGFIDYQRQAIIMPAV